MNDYEKLLDMIENVDKDDTETLDEIDARFWLYLYNPNQQFCGLEKLGFRHKGENQFEVLQMYQDTDNFESYTRSRDALKDVRPEGWWIESIFLPLIDSHGLVINDDLQFAECDMTRYIQGGNFNRPQVSGEGATEALAELHAITQAIQYEREHNDRD